MKTASFKSHPAARGDYLRVLEPFKKGSRFGIDSITGASLLFYPQIGCVSTNKVKARREKSSLICLSGSWMRAYNDLTSSREERFLDLLTTCESEQLRPPDWEKSWLTQSFWKASQVIWTPAGIASYRTPPPASPWSLFRMQKASSAGFLSPAGSSPVFWPSPAIIWGADCRSGKDTNANRKWTASSFISWLICLLGRYNRKQ